MTIWIWVVVALIAFLVIYELISWIRRRMKPVEVAAEEETAALESTQAELARANMKIAVLQNRLQEAGDKQEEERAALEAQYKAQLKKAEAAYQKQMVTLSERLAENGKGDWRVAAEREKAKKQAGAEKFPVRMAAEVAAWKAATFGETVGVDAAVSVDEALSAKDNDVSIGPPDPAASSQSAETADPNVERSARAPVNGLAAVVAAISGLDLAEIEATLEDEYGRPDDAPEEVRPGPWAEDADLERAQPAMEEPQEAEISVEPADSDAWRPDQDHEVMEQITVFEAVPEAAASAVPDEDLVELSAADDAVTSAVTDEDNGAESERPSDAAAGEQAHVEEQVNYFGSPWSELDDPAMQRALARRLSSEMDADYLDEEEFWQEMGIDQAALEQAAAFGAAVEDSMGGKNWVTDPMEELAIHLNGGPLPEQEEAADGVDVENEAPEERFEVPDDAWEALVYNGQPAGEEDLDAADAEAVNVPETAVEEAEEKPDLPAFLEEQEDLDDENSAIAATVAAILARAPEGRKQAVSQAGAAAVRERGGSGAQVYEAPDADDPLEGDPLAVVAAREEAAEPETAVAGTNGSKKRPQIPAFVWNRKPIVWDAQYFDNIRLAEQPAVMRKDNEIDFDWRGMAPARGIEPRTFSVRWTGILPLEEGQYRFTASAPDGLRLWLNDRLVISAWYDQSEQTYHRDFFWRGGPIDVRVEHYENGGDAKAFLTWERVA